MTILTPENRGSGFFPCHTLPSYIQPEHAESFTRMKQEAEIPSNSLWSPLHITRCSQWTTRAFVRDQTKFGCLINAEKWEWAGLTGRIQQNRQNFRRHMLCASQSPFIDHPQADLHFCPQVITQINWNHVSINLVNYCVTETVTALKMHGSSSCKSSSRDVAGDCSGLQQKFSSHLMFAKASQERAAACLGKIGARNGQQ